MESGSRVPLLAWVLVLAGWIGLIGAVSPGVAQCKVYLTRDRALALYAGDSLRIETRTAYLTPVQTKAIQDAAEAPFQAARVTYYVAVDSLGAARLYLYLDMHTVRTMVETVLIALDREGVVRSVEVLAFHEPEDYLPPSRWLALLPGRSLDEDLRPGEAMPPISGATLTARAITDAVRRALAIHATLEPQVDQPRASGPSHEVHE